GTWIIRTNDELNKIIKNKNIVNYIRAQRLAWFGHVCRLSEDRIVKKLFQWKPLTTRCQDLKKLRSRTGSAVFMIGSDGKRKLFRRPKRSTNEAVVPLKKKNFFQIVNMP
ncbi:hypothetical protein C0J52_24298, partial [Blattella germanica]